MKALEKYKKSGLTGKLRLIFEAILPVIENDNLLETKAVALRIHDCFLNGRFPPGLFHQANTMQQAMEAFFEDPMKSVRVIRPATKVKWMYEVERIDLLNYIGTDLELNGNETNTQLKILADALTRGKIARGEKLLKNFFSFRFRIS